MFRLVQADTSATGQGNRGDDSPIRLLYLGADHIFGLQCSNESTQIIAHQVQHRTQHFMSRMMQSGACIEWVDGGLCRGHAENQPAMPDIDARKSKSVTKEGPIRFRIPAMKQKVRADDHGAEYIGPTTRSLTNFAAPLKIDQDASPWLANRIRAAKMPVPYRHEGSFRTSFRLQTSGGVAQVARATVS